MEDLLVPEEQTSFSGETVQWLNVHGRVEQLAVGGSCSWPYDEGKVFCVL